MKENSSEAGMIITYPADSAGLEKLGRDISGKAALK